jgi:hypothetical protein
MDRMTPPEGCHRYRERIGAFVLGKLDTGELEAVRAHLDGCPECRAEVRELEPVVAALADADPDRIGEDARPPGDLEESTFAPILKEIRRTRRGRGRRFGWSGLAAAAIFAVVIGLAGLTGLVEPAAALVEPLSFSVAPGVKVEGHLIAHASGTEIRLVVSGSQRGQTYGVTLVSEDGKRVDAGTFIGAGDGPMKGTFNAALLRKDAQRLEVRTPGGEPAFFAKLPEKPREKVREWPLLGILPWAAPDLQNKAIGPSAEDPPKVAGSGGEAPREGGTPEGDVKVSSPGGGRPGAAPPEGSQPGGGLRGPPASAPPASAPPASAPPASAPPASAPPASGPPASGPPASGPPPHEQTPAYDQYETQP